MTSPDIDRIRARFVYWVRGTHGVLREHHATFWMWPTSRATLVAELAASAFTPVSDQTDPTVLAVRLARAPSAVGYR